MLAPRQPGPSLCTPKAPRGGLGLAGEGARPGSRGRAPFPPRRAGGGRLRPLRSPASQSVLPPWGFLSASVASGKGVPRLGGPGGKERRGERRPRRARRARPRPSVEASAESRAPRVLQDRGAGFRGLSSPLFEMERLHGAPARAQSERRLCHCGLLRARCAVRSRCQWPMDPVAPLSGMERRATCSRSPSWSALTVQAAGGGCTARAAGARRRSRRWTLARWSGLGLATKRAHARTPLMSVATRERGASPSPRWSWHGPPRCEPRSCTMERAPVRS